jgi:hypothetical protein
VEPRALKRAVILGALGIAVAGGAWFGWSAWRRPSVPTRAGEIRRVVPEGTRIRVEVTNATDVRGLARRAMLYLRDLGFDVVKINGVDARRDTTLVIDRTGHPEWAKLASEALDGAPIESRADSAGFVDLTILLGSTWRPPPQTLHP